MTVEQYISLLLRCALCDSETVHQSVVEVCIV